MSTNWSLLLFMTVTPRLVPAAKEVLARLASVAPSPRVDIAIQVDTRGKDKRVRYRLQNKKLVPLAPRKWKYRPLRGLRDFIDWGLEGRPASQRTALVIWGEGGGWIYPAGLYEGSRREPIDASLAEAIGGSKRARVDVLGFDACLMGMVEILYGARGLSGAQVASETFVPFAGWPYRAMLEALDARPERTAAGFAERLVPCVKDSKASPALAAFSTKRGDALGAAFRRLAGELRKIPRARHAELARARAEMLHVGNPLFVDVESMLRAVQRRVRARGVTAAVAGVRRELDRARLAKASPSPDDRGLSGLSVFFPEVATSLLAGYEELEFAQKTGWGKMLDRFLGPVAT